jgi:hypothetical protein
LELASRDGALASTEGALASREGAAAGQERELGELKAMLHKCQDTIAALTAQVTL